MMHFESVAEHMPNLNLKKEDHELTNVSVLIHVSMAYYFVEFSPNCCSFFLALCF